MRTLTIRSAVDLTPLIAGTGLILASGVIYVAQRVASTAASFGWVADARSLIESDWRIALTTTIDTFALASVGLALIAFWGGRQIGLRSERVR